MPFDGIVATAVANELDDKLSGGRIFKIYQPERDTLIFHIRANNENLKLLLSCNANSARIHLTELDLDNPSSPPMFCMLLRKHLNGGTINKVECDGFERIINLYVESSDELGDRSIKKVIIETMGRHSNIILVNNSGKIIDSIKHVDQGVNRVREIMPAREYILPPAQDKTPITQLDIDSFILSIKNRTGSVSKAILSEIKGFSPVLCREVCIRAGVDPDSNTSNIDSIGYLAIAQVLKDMIIHLNNNDYSPCIVIDNNSRKVVDFHAFELTQYVNYEKYNNLSHAIDSFYKLSAKRQQIKTKSNDLIKLVKQNIERCERKISIHVTTLEENSSNDTLRLYGELITANIYALKKGMKHCKLQNYYDTEENFLTIELDENLTPQQNAQRYFKKYNKGKNAYAYAQEQLNLTKKELDYLESVLYNLDEANSPESVEEIREELKEQGYLRKTYKRKKNTVKLTPLSFTSSEGYQILVGRNNVQNDELTMKIAHPNDMWFHTKDIPGSHVIVRTTGDISEKSLIEAASLAAWFSKARNSSKVQVDYTRVKYVKKPSGAKPGMVIYVNHKTIIVDPKNPETL
ncbi:MAG: fibronectin/fibrinogen-binding protein [Clostridiaceae bacterium]|jgi:predicted ribosome quality control (RQC) complex YloA/Tae2 family protein|nr:fibronectin/fibrinogen-binding protein [Clostridiaceae bacterium]